MLRKLILLFFAIAGVSGFAQDVTAVVKTASSTPAGKDLKIEIAVNKTGISGFMKYFQELPEGYTAADIDSKGGNFTYADNGAKIIWISPPAEDQFTMAYKIAIPSTASGSISIGGKFSYVVGNERKIFDIVPQTITIGGSGNTAETKTPVKEVVKETPKEEPKPVETKTSPPAEEKPVVTETKTVPPPAEEKPKPAETKKEIPVVTTPVNKTPVTAAATSTAGRSYKVQIGAFSQKPNITGVPEPSTLLLDNGMTKYFSGNFKTYEEAKKRKNEMVEKGFQGAFIVSFENGKIVK
jgi:hypothetical protein